MARGHCREIWLDFLSRDEAASYLDLEFPGHDLPVALARVIHEKTEGSPLFMVDLVRDLRDRQVIVRSPSGWMLAESIAALEHDLPESVRSMIERKVAQLCEEDRQLLICASVQGHTFDSAVVARALKRDPAELEERLEVLDRVHAFVRVVGEEALPDRTPTLRCGFVHVLYQNALYGSLRVTRRMSMSAAVAQAMISFYGHDNPSVASELALLFEAARDSERAADYFFMASQNALRVFAFVEAAAIAEHGLRLVSGLMETSVRDAKELKLQIALGTASVAIKGYAAPDVERAYGRARELCRALGDPEELAAVLFGLFVYYLVAPSFHASRELGDEMLAVATREKSDAFRLQGLLMHGMTGFWRGDVEPAVRELEEGIAIYDTQRRTISGKTPLFDHGVASRRYQALCLWLHGWPDWAVRRSEEALADARTLTHPLTLASALSFDSMLHYFRREPQVAGERAAAAVACTREYVLTYWLGFATALHGWSVAQLADDLGATGSWEEGVAQIGESLNQHASAGARTFRAIGCALLGETYMIRGRVTEAAAALDEGLRVLEETDERFWEAELHRLRGELLLVQGGLEPEAEDCFERAIAVARQKKEKSLELRSLMSVYRLVQLQAERRDRDGRLARIHEHLAHAYASFTEGFATSDLRDARALLDNIRDRPGNPRI